MKILILALSLVTSGCLIDNPNLAPTVVEVTDPLELYRLDSPDGYGEWFTKLSTANLRRLRYLHNEPELKGLAIERYWTKDAPTKALFAAQLLNQNGFTRVELVVPPIGAWSTDRERR